MGLDSSYPGGTAVRECRSPQTESLCPAHMPSSNKYLWRLHSAKQRGMSERRRKKQKWTMRCEAQETVWNNQKIHYSNFCICFKHHISPDRGGGGGGGWRKERGTVGVPEGLAATTACTKAAILAVSAWRVNDALPTAAFTDPSLSLLNST
jgi:hypothetical protein